MPRGKKKAAKKKAEPKKDTVEKTSKKKRLVLDINKDIDLQFNDYWDSTEPDYIQGVYGTPEHTVGCIKTIYSGLPTLDKILAVQRDTNYFGFPLNKMIEVFGAESCGKTTWLKYLAALFIKNGGRATFVDFEHKFDPKWQLIIAKNMGITVDDFKKKFRLSRPKHFEWFSGWLIKYMKTIITAKDTARKELKKLESKKRISDDHDELVNKYKKITEMPFVILVDSIANMYTKAEVEGEDESADHVAELARRFAARVKLMRQYLQRAGLTIVWANQLRDKIGSRFRAMTTPGGHSVKHNSDLRIKIDVIGTLKRTRDKVERKYGSENKFMTMKNQIGPQPFQAVILRFLFDRGYFSLPSLLDACAREGIIKKIGSVYKINGGKKMGIITLDESDIDESMNDYPKLETVLEKIYCKKMREN